MKLIILYIFFLLSFCSINADDMTIRWWNEGEEIITAGTAFNSDANLIYLSSYHRLSTEEYPQIQTWDINTGDFINSIETELKPGIIDVSSDGSKLLLSSGYNKGTKVEIIDLNTRSSMKTVQLIAGNMFANIKNISFLPDGKQYAVWIPENNSIDIYNVDDNKLENRIVLDYFNKQCVSFSSNGKFVAVAYSNRSVYIWDLIFGELVMTLNLPYNAIDIAFSNNDQQIAALMNKDHTTNLVKSISFSTTTITNEWSTDKSSEKIMYAGNDQYIITATNDNRKISVHNSTNGKFYSPEISYNGRYLSSANQLLAGCNENDDLIIMDITSQNVLHSLRKYDPSNSHEVCHSVMVGPNKVLFSGGNSGELFISNLEDGSLSHKLQMHTAPIRSMDIDELGILAVSCSWDDTVKLWNGFTYELIDTYFAGCNYPEAVAISPDGEYFAVAGSRNGILVQHIPSGVQHRLDESWENIQALDFSNDSKTLIAANKDKTIRKYELNANNKYSIKTYFLADSTENPFLSGIKTVKYSNNGKYFATAGGDHKAKLWDAITSQHIHSFIDTSGWKSTINAIAFSPNDDKLYTADALGIIRVFDLETGVILAIYEDLIKKSYDYRINSISLSEDGSLLTLALNEGSVMALDLNTTSLVESMMSMKNEFIRIYPNPATSEINIEIVTKSQDIVSIVLTDVHGKEIVYLDNNLEEIADNNTTLDISHIPAGVYFIKILTTERIYHEKLIKY
jgi:WD40 repeat protein